MRFMLDTNTCIEIIRRPSPDVFRRMRAFSTDDISISMITLAGLQYGVAKSARPLKNAIALAKFCAPFAIAPFDHAAAETYGRVRANLERKGTPVGPLDTLIAAHALSLDVTLVTSNEREFQRVEGLGVENWMREKT